MIAFASFVIRNSLKLIDLSTILREIKSYVIANEKFGFFYRLISIRKQNDN
jgi:hypothetical protein